MAKKPNQFATNRCGIKVRKCCASCIHKCLSSTSARTCALHGKKEEVDQLHVCDHWQMEPSLDNAGDGQGKVKKKDFLMFVILRRRTEDQSIELGIISEDERLSIEDLREEYISKNGNIYYG